MPRDTAGMNATASQSPGMDSAPAYDVFNRGVDQLRNFTPRAQQVLALSRKEADRFNHNFVGTEHLLLGIISLGQGTAVNVLARMALDLQVVRAEVEKQVGIGPDQKVVGSIPYTPRVKKVLALAAKEAKALNHTYVGTEHILLGLLREGDGVAARVLTNLGLNLETTRQQVLRELDPNFLPKDPPVVVPVQPKSHACRSEPIDTAKRYDVFCREGDREVIYCNVQFKAVRTLLKQRDDDSLAEYIELEHENGATVFVARWYLIRFCEHTPKPATDSVSEGNS